MFVILLFAIVSFLNIPTFNTYKKTSKKKKKAETNNINKDLNEPSELNIELNIPRNPDSTESNLGVNSNEIEIK